MSAGSSRPVVRLLLGEEHSVSTLVTLVGVLLGLVAPLGLLAVEISGLTLHLSAQGLLSLVMVAATGVAMANAYFGGGLLASAGVVLLVPVRVAVATLVLGELGVHVGLSPGVTATKVLLVALGGGLAAHAAGRMAGRKGNRTD